MTQPRGPDSPRASTSSAPFDVDAFDAGAAHDPAYRQALEHLYGRLDTEALDPKTFATVERDMEAYRLFLERLGDPHLASPTVHVTGTRGKGSTVAMLEAILRRGGYRTGATVSPHLVEVRERIRIEGDSLPRGEFARLYDVLRPVAEETLNQGSYRTVFELITALAFLAFRDRQVDAALVEVGLGGRLDATNVVKPVLSVVTRIGLDHTHLLGNTVEEIAWDKGHIIKPGAPSIIAEQPGGAGKVLEDRAREVGSDLWKLGHDVHLTVRSVTREGCRFDLATPLRTHKDLHTPLLGEHQAQNAALAVAAADRLHADGHFNLSEEVIREGLAASRWPGRGEVLRTSPTLLLDGAHTPQGATALAKLLGTCWPEEKRILLLGINRDKDAEGFLGCFDRAPDRVVATAAATPRARTPEELAELVRGYGWNAETCTLQDALPRALELAGEDGLVVVTGSLYIVGAIRRVWLQG